MFEVRLSVRELVEFLLRTGSIDSRFTGFDRALEGARIHRKLQREAGEGYESEVFLRQSYPLEDFLFTIEGRADGIFTDSEGTVVIDEIKTTTLPVEEITESHNPVHWAQGQVYAAIHCLQNELPAADVRLTYYQVDENLTLRYTRHYSAGELSDFVAELLTDYLPWARRKAQWVGIRQLSLEALAFPFGEYRPGQRAMAGQVYRTCRDGGALLCQAPTGIGKTMSTLFPALKAMAMGGGDRIFYLTARTTTRQAAQNALTLLEGAQVRSITLTAKDKICPREKRECTPEACPYANGYYSRIREALWDGLDGLRYRPEDVLALAEKHRVCPFELSLDISLWCDVIIGDYNYLFDPVAALQRFFESGGDYLFLLDEAHNLPDRAREMYSAHLLKSQLYEAKKLLGGKGRLQTAMGRVNNAFVELRHRCEEAPGRCLFLEKCPEELSRPLLTLSDRLQSWLNDNREHSHHEELLALYFEVRAFLRVLESYDEHYITQVTAPGKEVRAELLCLDPSQFLAQRFAKGRSAVLFSATLSPPAYYKDLSGLPDAAAVALPSPFSRENLGLFHAVNLDVRYQDRERTLDTVCQYLATMVEGRRGNYLAFFPSYAYLRRAAERFSELYPDIPLHIQESSMDDEARRAFLERFQPDPAESLLGFGVLGGVFGEGVDLTGDRLIGTAIVTVGLPQVNPVQEQLREYFERTRGDGFDYAYRFPGMNKVLQAAGRVIRTPEDKGVVLLLDRRFGQPGYTRLMPTHWSHCCPVSSPAALSERLSDFWKEP